MSSPGRRRFGWLADALKREGLPLAAFVALTMLLAWRLGQDVGWDLRNYHFYNAHQFLTNRFQRDLEPAGVQTYYSPLLDIPFYVAVRIWKLRPLIVALALAAFHGLNLWLVYRLTRLVLIGRDPIVVSVAAPVAALTGAFGTAFYIEIASTYGDNAVSVLVLAALTVLIGGVNADGPARRRAVWLSGSLAGLAAGAKLPAGMYALGLTAGVLAVGGNLRQRAGDALRFGVSAAVGFMATYGFWMWLMFRQFGSPLFPYMDASLRSPYATVAAELAARYGPRTALQALFYPFFFLTPQTLTHEAAFSDGRLAVAFLSVVAVFLTALARRRQGATAAFDLGDRRLFLVIISAGVSYVVWLRTTPVYRFVVSLELIVPVLLFACLAYGLRSTVKVLTLGVSACLLLVATAQYPAMERIGWTSTYFGVDEASLSRYDDATILMWDMPNGYLVPFFPPGATFVRILGNWSGMQERARQLIGRADPRRRYILDRPDARFENKQAVLASLGLALDPNRCQWTSSVIETFRVCELVDARAGPSSSPAAPEAPPAYEGYYDAADCTTITGWAWDPSRPDAPLEIDVYGDDRLIARVPAKQFREDLRGARKGSGEHAFAIPTPPDLRDGREHVITLLYARTSTALSNGPRRITCRD